jgi:lysophospholipase L1-like esterase
MTKTVLAFGDSLTFGSSPIGEGRHPKQYRWPDVVSQKTGHDVISEGLRGRTTAFDQNTSPANLNGVALLPSLLHSHAPIDLLTIMLGTNDCYFGFGAHQASTGLARLIEIARHHPFRSTSQKAPKILLMAPPPMRVAQTGEVSDLMIAQSVELIDRIEKLAHLKEVAFFDTSSVAAASKVDGIHLDAENTHAIGVAVAPVIAEILKN